MGTGLRLQLFNISRTKKPVLLILANVGWLAHISLASIDGLYISSIKFSNYLCTLFNIHNGILVIGSGDASFLYTV